MMMAVAVPVTLFMNMVCTHSAGSSGHHTRHVLELNGGVMNAQATKRFVNILQNGSTGGVRHVLYQYVRAKRMRVGAKTPDVQIVHVQNSFYRAHGGSDLI